MNWSLQKLNVACAKKIENKESPPKVVTPTVNEESVIRIQDQTRCSQPALIGDQTNACG
jgi:hypothetical protein